MAGSSPQAKAHISIILSAVIGAHIVFAAMFWYTTWDDSAITLAHARTLALNGIIAPTPLSNPVEGYSTTLWMLLHALLAPVLSSAQNTLTAAKALGFMLNAVAILLTYRLAKRFISPILALGTAVLFGTLSTAWIESVNGMEAPLFAVLLLASLLTFGKRSPSGRVAFITSSTLLILVRWEAIWYLVPFVLYAVIQNGWKSFFRSRHILWLSVFIGSCFWRLLYFGSLVPNTILAKRHLPYSPDYGVWGTIAHHIKPFVFLFLGLAPILTGLVAIIVVVSRQPKVNNVRKLLLESTSSGLTNERILLALMVGAGLIFNLVIGQNWGPRNRMFYVAFPPLLILIMHQTGWFMDRLSSHKKTISHILLVCAISLNSFVGFIWAFRAQQSERITIENMLTIARGVEQIRVASGNDQLTYAAPDMGGILLFYGQHYRVIDLALLCNAELAKEGYARIPSYLFEQEQPEIIQTHWLWTELSNVESSDTLYSEYVPLFANGFRFLVRRDIAGTINSQRLVSGSFDQNGDTEAYRNDHFVNDNHVQADLDINRRFGNYLVLNSGL